MPELPEVETIVRDMIPNLLGKTINGLTFGPKCAKHILECTPTDFMDYVLGHEIIAVLRKGKYIIMPLSNGSVLVFHLGMTGKLLFNPSEHPAFIELTPHTHLILHLYDFSENDINSSRLEFNDVRLFGHIWLRVDVEDVENLDVPGLQSLGPDALGITLKEFNLITQSKRSIKSILLDQTKLAGVGNIYADEALFLAQVHPVTKANLLIGGQKARLWFAIKTVLQQGIKFRGSSVSDYVTADGSSGSFQNYHKVYGRKGQKCDSCDSLIERIKIIGRSTYFCPRCQSKDKE